MCCSLELFDKKQQQQQIIKEERKQICQSNVLDQTRGQGLESKRQECGGGGERHSHHRKKDLASAVKDEMEDMCVQTDRRVGEYEERKIEKFSPDSVK